MKICICTTPIRPIPTTYPPFGSMAIIQSLKKIDINCELYNIDYHRYSREEVREHFKLNHYKVVAISAVVSTAYAYTKFLAKTIKSVSPNTIIILGGNLAASAEILLRLADIDFCVAGDGEFVIQDLVLHIKDNKNASPKNLYKKIPGIAFIDDKDKFYFTGFGKKPTADEIEIPDYSILERDDSLQHFIPKNDANGEFNATVISAKGCVARCTFCHRWEKGYRVQPVDKVINHIKDLNLNYKVKHIIFGDENFGADREYTRILVKELGKLNITWEASGVRVRTVQLDDLKLWKSMQP